MKICLAQTHPETGKIAHNIQRHAVFVEKAVAHEAKIILFGELSLTGYEPALAQKLAIRPDDPRLDIFQTLANAGKMIICVGMPTPGKPRPGISLLIFQPARPRQLYTKQYLHPDEEPYFSAGQPAAGVIGAVPLPKVALAICYELAVERHASNAVENAAALYLASVAKFSRGVLSAHGRLAEIAKTYGMVTGMVNCVGPADGGECAGGTAVWEATGKMVCRLDSQHEGMLLYDTNSGAALAHQSSL